MNEDLEQKYLDVIFKKNERIRSLKERYEKEIEVKNKTINRLHATLKSNFLKTLSPKELEIFLANCAWDDRPLLNLSEDDIECNCEKCKNPLENSRLIKEMRKFYGLQN